MYLKVSFPFIAMIVILGLVVLGYEVYTTVRFPAHRIQLYVGIFATKAVTHRSSPALRAGTTENLVPLIC